MSQQNKGHPGEILLSHDQSNSKIKKLIYRGSLAVLIGIFLITACSNRPQSSNSPQENTIYNQFLDTMHQLISKGDEYQENGMAFQANYFYSIAASSTSAFRFAIDNLLFIKGEGKELAEISGEGYNDWDTIAAINYASPYPYYFEGLIHHIQGDLTKAEECYKNAIINENFPKEEFSFLYLGNLDVKELQKIKEDLIQLEGDIYTTYSQDFIILERNPMNFNDEFLRAKGMEFLNQKPSDSSIAEQYYSTALKINPFEPKNFTALAMLALSRQDVKSAILYVNEGLWIEPDDKALNQIAEVLNNGGKP